MSPYTAERSGTTTATPGRIVGLVVCLVLLVVGLVMSTSILEQNDADSIMVIQSPVSGHLTWYTSAGLQWQGFGKVTKYPKRGIHQIETQVRFNDGGHGTLVGSVQYEMPLDEKNLTALHTRFGSNEAIVTQLIQTVATKAVYMTGPLMSSKESYAEKRNDLIRDVEDQIANGVYQTRQREAKVLDPLTGQEKTAIVVEVVQEAGRPARQELAVLSAFGIKTFNFTIAKLPYDPEVEKQIAQQQQITMDVQTAIAESRKAEQRAITVEQQGKASAAQAKWEQEVVKAKEVTAAQQRLEVATIANKEADQYKEAALKKAEADATYRRRVMEADGALDAKLKAYVQVQQYYAQAIKDHAGPWVPSVVMGQGGAGANGATTLIDLLTAKSAKELGLDLATTSAKR